jgi:hypothetical protein
VELFPKNEKLKPGQKGSGINLGYFGNERIAYGKDGEELDLAGFLALAAERQQKYSNDFSQGRCNPESFPTAGAEFCARVQLFSARARFRFHWFL